MLPAGLLGDRYGRKRVMLIALALFGLGSAACALAPSAGAFIAARVLLGLAGAGVIVMALSALTVLFSEEERPKAVGIWAAANFLACRSVRFSAAGCSRTTGGAGCSSSTCRSRWSAVAAIAPWCPESRAAERPGLDPVGVALRSRASSR